MRWNRQLRKPPAAPGDHPLALLFYKAIAAVDKVGIETVERERPIDGWESLWSEPDQIVDIQVDPAAQGFLAMADVVVANDGGKVDQGANVEDDHQCEQVGADQPVVRALQDDTRQDQDETEDDKAASRRKPRYANR